MTNGWDEDQRSRVGRLQRLARQRPAAYRRRVVVLALIGYSLIFTVFLASVALLSLGPVIGWWLGGSNGGIVGIGVTVLGWLSIRWWGRGTRPPTGAELTRTDHPELFARVRHLEHAVGSVRIHRVHVDDGSTASIIQLPRARVFGVNENHLVLGLPLLSALTTQELEAVLAHELAHVRRDWSLAAWIWRAVRVFRRVTSEAPVKTSQNELIQPARWAEAFDVFSGGLTRDFELLADARAAAIVGSRALADALCRQVLVDARMAEWRMPRDSVDPPSDRTESLIRLSSCANTLKDRRRLGVALVEMDYRLHPHPSLGERLRALGESPRVCAPIEGPSAADIYLGWRGSELAAKLSRSWHQRVSAEWGTKAQTHRRNVEELCREWSVAGRVFLPDGRLCQLVERAITLHMLSSLPTEEIAPLEGPDAAFVRGDFEAAVNSQSLVVRAAALTQLAEAEQAAPRWITMLAHLEAEHALASDERRHLDEIALLVRPTLETETRLALSQRLRREPGLKCAWLVRRKVRYLPEHP
ncbi:MAG: M48 family metalloprotease, partial [Myxococcota bacterium]|nr:M48 family metalloprotease [Myxococcota bacterium]